MTLFPLSRRLRLVRLVLWWERLAADAVALLSLAMVATALALFDVLPLLPGWLHALALAGLVGLAALLLVRLIRTPPPDPAEVARRLEADSGQPHRPLAVLEDAAAAGDTALWRLHQERMAAVSRTLRPGWPRPVLPGRDPLALRFAALLLLVIALAGGTADWRGRLLRALSPAVELPGLGPTALEVWIVPPAHTGLPTRLLRKDGAPLDAPEGSTVRAVLAGGLGGAALEAGGPAVPFSRDDSGEQRVEARLGGGATGLVITQGWREVAAWPLVVVRDALPSIAITDVAEPDERGRLHLSLEASDDYGVTGATIEIRPLEGDEPPLVETLALPGAAPRTARLSHRLDLAAHDWAGRPARLAPVAGDGAGQSGGGQPVIVTLPERDFRHPVARALIAWRRAVSDAPRLGPEVAEELRGLMAAPEAFGGDVRVFLGLAVARRRLAAEAFDRAELRDLLWNLAVRLEDGGRPVAEQALEQARAELERAVAAGAPPRVLAELTERYREAVRAWLDALAAAGGDADTADGAETVTEDQLADMVDSLLGAAETGDRDAVSRRLAELSELLAGLGRPSATGPVDSAAARALERLRDLAARQRRLQDQSFRKTGPLAEDEEPVPPPPPSAAERAESRRLAREQAALAEALRRLAETMAPPPASLDQAGQEMRQAETSLGESDWPLAAERQGEVLRLLRDGARELAERMAAARGSGGAGLADPLGRSRQGRSHRDDGSTKVPAQEAETRRARDILDELRRRAGDAGRPPPELDYLRRVLRQY